MSELETLRAQSEQLRSRIWALEHERDQAISDEMIGKCYRFRNSYGSGETWPLYMRVDSADGSRLFGFQFERDSHGEFSAAVTSRSHGRDGYEEITPEELQAAWSQFAGDLMAEYERTHLPPPDEED